MVQVETFGVSLNAEGTCFYGGQARRRRHSGHGAASMACPTGGTHMRATSRRWRQPRPRLDRA